MCVRSVAPRRFVHLVVMLLAVVAPRAAVSAAAARGTSPAPAPANRVAIDAGADGGSFVAWIDRGAGGARGVIRASRREADGAPAPGWPVGGTALAASHGRVSGLSLASDGAGGAWIVWSDRPSDPRRPSGDDVFALHVTARGAIAADMPASGATVSAAPGHQRKPAAIPDGAGGLVVAWTDHRGRSPEVFAQRLDARGVIASGWPANGRRIGPVGTAAPVAGLAVIDDEGRLRPAAAGAAGIGAAFRLGLPRPNPTPGETRIDLTLPAAGPVSADLFDVSGRLVRRLVDGTLEAGSHSLGWDGNDASGHPAPAAVYFIRVQAPGGHAVRSVVRTR